MKWVVVAVAGILLVILIVYCLDRYIYLMNRRFFAWLRTRLGRGLTVEELSRRLEISSDRLREFEPGYHSATISKKTGGTRKLLIPDNQTKRLQRQLLQRVLGRLRAHPAACGFERGKSIVFAAAPHCQKAVVLRLDVVDFFPSTSAHRVEAYFCRVGWNREAARLLTRLTCYEDALPQGAPTSPRLSNLVNYYLDVQMTALARRRGADYTRYADDMTFSFKHDRAKRVRGVVQAASRLLRRYGYRVHQHKKLRVRRRHQQQRVVGLVVNFEVQLPRSVRRRLRAVRHHLETGRPATMTQSQLEGWEALEKMVVSQRDSARCPS